MSSIPRIKFEIACEGSSQDWKNANVKAIDLGGTKSRIYAKSDGPEGSSLKAGRLKWCTPKNNDLDQIALTPEIAKTVEFKARAFESYLSATERALMIRRVHIPIPTEDHPELVPGNCYLIKVQVVSERNFKATFTKVDEQASKTSQDKKEEKVHKAEHQRPTRNMAEELIEELRNLRFAGEGAHVFDSSSTSPEIVAHVMQPVPLASQAGSETNPDSGPAQNASNSDQLSQDEFQRMVKEGCSVQ